VRVGNPSPTQRNPSRRQRSGWPPLREKLAWNWDATGWPRRLRPGVPQPGGLCPMNAEPRANRALNPSAMNWANLSGSFHLVVRLVGSRSWRRITSRRMEIGWSCSQSRNPAWPRLVHSAWTSGRAFDERADFGTSARMVRSGKPQRRASTLAANAGLRSDSLTSKSTKPRSRAISGFSFRIAA
jgi:hypothetical protein